MLTEQPDASLMSRFLMSRSNGAHFRISRRTIILLCCTAAMVIGAVALSLSSFNQVNNLSRQHLQTHRQIDSIIDLLSSLKDAETAQRGYLLTGDETYLAPYNAVRDTVALRIRELRSHSVPKSSQKLFDEIEQLTNAKLTELAATIAMKRRHESEAAIALVMNGSGKQLMDELRADIAKVLLEQQQIRDRQLQENAVDQQRLFEGIVATGLLALLLSMATSFLTLRSARHYVDKRLHAVIDSAMDAIITIDEHSVIQLFNPAACHMYGIADSEALGQSINRFIPERFRRDHLTHLQEFDSSGSATRYLGNARPVVGLRADGTEFPGEATISQVKVGGHKMFTVIIRDQTERMLAETALKASQDTLRDLLEYGHRKKEQERSRIAQIIHDDLGTRLTAAKANLSVLMDQEQRSGSAENPRLKEASALLDASFDTVRNVILELRPSVLDNLGIWSALEWYAGRNAKNTGIDCDFFIDPALEGHVPAPELATALFRILQETLSNVTLHSHATAVTVRLGTEAGFITMEVDDNGSGIDLDKVHQFKSWGITGMGERARYLGGSIAITQSASGTLVKVLLPLVDRED